MPYIILAALIIAAIYGPRLWVKYVFQQYRTELAHIPGTGAELARHLIKKFELSVTVDETEPLTDHYDPKGKSVRLGPDNFHGKSLTAIAVAAHEVGHAIQFARNDPTCRLYWKYFPIASSIKRAGIMMMSLPFFGLAFQVPTLSGVAIAIAVITMLVSVLTFAIILPQEWDASFYKALPILESGNYVEQSELPAIRKILRAAALTYVAAALSDILSLWRWRGILRGLRI